MNLYRDARSSWYADRNSDRRVSAADHATIRRWITKQVNVGVNAIVAGHDCALKVKEKNSRQSSAADRDAAPLEPGERQVLVHAASAFGVVAIAIAISFCIASDGLDSTRGRQVYSYPVADFAPLTPT